MKDALIGFTGFVGSNLLSQRHFDVCANSKNIDDLRGQRFDMVVCAGVSAVKWKANKDPEEDARGIAALTDVLDTISARRLVLISTVDVFALPKGQTEMARPNTGTLRPYGRHRLELEERVAEQFGSHCIVRLPALFGPGLRKNILFDLLYDNLVAQINPASSFQWYPLTRLWADIQKAIEANLPLVHFATEPVLTSDILNRFFPDVQPGSEPVGEAHYDFHTIHAHVFGSKNPYLMSRVEVLDELAKWLGTVPR